MTKSVKKHDYLLPFARLFTRADEDAYDSIPFGSADSYGDETVPALTSPTTWDPQAVDLMSVAACQGVPADLRTVEENTVPSWLWRHQSRKSTRIARETDLRDIINRAVGSAAAKAWKLALFTSEKHARTFYDEARYALMQRQVGIMPDLMASWGLSWAYGVTEDSIHKKNKPFARTAAVSNADFDALISSSKTQASPFWKKLFTVTDKKLSSVSLRLTDIAADWYSTDKHPARAALDLMALRHNDGSVNIDAVRQSARLLTILLDLHERPDVTISLVNLAPLLLALGLAYDSDAGRAMAASLAALVTAECTATSAELAALRGISTDFSTNRDAVMRSVRNHRRAVYGDNNDYEKLSVLPAPLPLRNCPDLALVAEAQRRWDEALDLARAFGLRATRSTDLTASPLLGMLMSGVTQGLEPLPRLTMMQQDDADLYRIVMHPAVSEAFMRLKYTSATAKAAAHHVIGIKSLRKAEAINTTTLRACGLNETALEKIESYLPFVDSIQLAITPWIIGVDFCKTYLGISERTLNKPTFDLLHYLGFSSADIEAANVHLFGHATLRNAKLLHIRHRALFACGSEISADARLRMATAVQSFISGDTGIVVSVPLSESVKFGTETALTAWSGGLKSLTINFDPLMKATERKFTTTRRIKAASISHAKPISPPPRRAQNGKVASSLSTKKTAAKRGAHKGH